jgi:hypothetical protein
MAIIDPVRLLQANPAENLSNLNAVDQADSLTDQSLMSFPDELMAAKQQQRDEDAAFEQGGQNPSDNPFILQNLPVNPSLAVAQPANIADSLANASGAAITSLTPGNPSLTQLEVAQSIVADDGLMALPPEGDALLATQAGDAIAATVDPAIALTPEVSSAAPGLMQNPAMQTGALVSPLVTDSAAPVTLDAVAAQNPLATATPLSQTMTAGTEPTTEKVVAPQAAITTPSDSEQPVLQSTLQSTLQAAMQTATQTTEQTPVDTDAVVATAVNVAALAETAEEADATNAALVNTNALRTQNTQQNQATAVLNAAALEVSQDAVQLHAAASVASNEAKAVAAQASPAAIQESTVAPENAALRTANLNAKDVKTGVTLAPADDIPVVSAKVSDALLAADVADATQQASIQTAIVAARTESVEAADAIVQGLRLDNAKGAELNMQESVALDAVAIKDITLADTAEGLTLASTTNSANGIADFGTRMTSPFSQELRLAQSAAPLRLEPQQASLVAGPLHVEVMRVLREGGGRVIMEVTPPDQGAIQLDLRLDGNGKAYLIVEGASDSTKARLEQGGAQLKEQLEQMGLSLSLDMRDRSSQSDQIPFAFNPSFARNNNAAGAEAGVELGDLMSVSRSGITPDGRVSIYA